MTPQAHTPGPWHIGAFTGGHMIYGPLGEQVADLRGEVMLMPEEAEANRALLVSAPELLEALRYAETILSATECTGEKQLGNGAALDLARSAIARATGKE